MAAVIEIQGAAQALLLLAALLPAGARADRVTFQQCKDVHSESNTRLISSPRPDIGATVLGARNCQITHISSDDFDGLTNLDLVYLNENKLRQVDPAVFRGAPKIGYLYLDGNSLSAMPVFGEAVVLTKTEQLVIKNNKITRLENPKTFSNMKALQVLNLHGNLIEYINPDVLKELQQLGTLNLSCNRLKYISDNMFAIPRLHFVDLEANMIEYVSPGAFRATRLQYLFLSENQLTHLPEHFVANLTSTGEKLSFFFFHANPFQCACLFQLLGELKQLDDCTYYLLQLEKECTQPHETQCKRPSETEYINSHQVGNATDDGSVKPENTQSNHQHFEDIF